MLLSIYNPEKKEAAGSLNFCNNGNEHLNQPIRMNRLNGCRIDGSFIDFTMKKEVTDLLDFGLLYCTVFVANQEFVVTGPG